MRKPRSLDFASLLDPAICGDIIESMGERDGSRDASTMTEQQKAQFRENHRRVQEQMGDAARRAGREPGEVRLMAVTKMFPESAVETAWRSGITLFGENRVQEAERKYAEWLGKLELHLIGHLQRNKAKVASRIAGWVDSVDKAATAEALDRAAAGRGRTVNILLEYNSSGEESKFGVRGEEELLRLVESCAKLTNLRIRGVMTLGPFTEDLGRIRRAFERTRLLYEKAVSRFPDLAMDTLSMGMSGDFELAIEEGSTMVRVGSALFGARPSA
jgi:pyridoxal phosphate enzyme (YggS family)